MNLLGQNWNHQLGFIEQKTGALHHRGFKLKFPIMVMIITHEIVVTRDQNNIESNDNVSTVALLQSFYFKLKSAIFSTGFFTEIP